MMGEDGVDELKVGHIMKDSLKKSFEQVHAQASSVLLLTLKWGDLHQHYEKVERDLEERARRLQKAEKVFEERRKELALKEEMFSFEAQIHECGEQLDAKRKEVAMEEGRLHSCSQNLKCRKLELESVMQSVSDSSTQLAAMKKELNSIKKSLEERSKEVHVKEQHLATVERSLKEISARVKVEKKELSSVEKARAEQRKELELKEKESVSLRRSLEDRLRGVEMKEMQLDGRAKDLILKQKEIDVVRQRVEDQKKEMEVKKAHYDLEKRSLMDLSKEVERKEQELEGLVKELELKQEKQEFLDICGQAVDFQRKLFEQIVFNEQPNKALVHDHFLSLMKASKNPPELVLNVVLEFYSLLRDDRLCKPEIVITTCINWLDKLLVDNPPQIGNHVQEAAIQLAHEWKEKIKVGAEDQSEILGFLHLLAAFRIFSAFRADEYGALLDRVVDQKHALKLRHHLGMTETAKASNIPHKVKTKELGQLAVCNKRPRTDGSLNAS